MDNPLSKADVAALQRALFRCNLQDQLIERAKSCGLDCSEDEAACQAARDFLTKVNAQLGRQPTK